uniref:Uncharacterized protein n=1 Tax=Anguilla anguilla TaxID=7936 RepID=A0A0E9V8L0_ANGAN
MNIPLSSAVVKHSRL